MLEINFYSMFNKKIKIIIFGTMILLFLVILIFYLKQKNQNISNNIVQSSNETATTILKELKTDHPEFSEEQLKFYQETAQRDKLIIEPCQNRGDEKDCISSVAFIKNDTDLCHDLEDTNSHFGCFNAILKKEAKAKVDQCQPLFGDDFINCLREVFVIYKEQSSCATLLDKEAQTICEELFNYETAYMKYDRELCKNVKNEKLNQYCFKNIIDKFQDSDNDGLTDLDEINKYHTNPNRPDTDGDGINDGDEVNKYHTNPNDPNSKPK